MISIKEFRSRVESLEFLTRFQERIPELDNYHRNHIRERLYLCGLASNEYINDLDRECIDTIKRNIEEKNYRAIIDEYIIPTYKDKETKRDQFKFFSEISDVSILWYLSIGVLCERVSILRRNNIDVDIKGEDYIEKMISIASQDNFLYKESPTYYINSLMYCYNLCINTPDISSILENFINSRESDYRYMYGLTHIIIQQSHFYRSYVDDTLGIGALLEDFMKRHPLDPLQYIDLYYEIALCLKLLRRKYVWSWLLNLNTSIFKDIDIKREHTYSLYILLWNLII